MVMPFGLTNAPATFQWEMNCILRPFLEMELVIDTKLAIDDNVQSISVTY
jgi:hypothetical protein